jgi:cation diffusion facilitator CzcD-associated flavoprotein CzcO
MFIILDQMLKIYDVLIVGGGPSGINGYYFEEIES